MAKYQDSSDSDRENSEHHSDFYSIKRVPFRITKPVPVLALSGKKVTTAQSPAPAST
jgi:hypothetical protein